MKRLRSTGGSLLAAIVFLVGLACAGCSDDDNGGGNNNNNNNAQTLECADLCPGVLAAGCTNGPSDQADCESGCDEVEARCSSELDAVLDCVDDSPTFSCDANGFVYPDGCQTEQDAIYACMNVQPPTCADICPGVVAAGCSNGPPDVATCVAGCTAAEAACPTEFSAVLDCAGSTPTYSCDASGFVYPDGCQTEQDAINLCMSSIEPLDCADICPDYVAEGCAYGPPTVGDCMDGCELSEVACAVEYAATVQCIGQNPTYSCDASGMVVPDGCETEQQAIYSCLDDVNDYCGTICAAVVAAACANGPPDLGSCETGCGQALSDCPAEFVGIMDCAGPTPTFSCDASDMPYADGCLLEQTALNVCLSP